MGLWVHHREQGAGGARVGHDAPEPLVHLPGRGSAARIKRSRSRLEMQARRSAGWTRLGKRWSTCRAVWGPLPEQAGSPRHTRDHARPGERGGGTWCSRVATTHDVVQPTWCSLPGQPWPPCPRAMLAPAAAAAAGLAMHARHDHGGRASTRHGGMTQEAAPRCVGPEPCEHSEGRLDAAASHSAAVLMRPHSRAHGAAQRSCVEGALGYRH